MTTGDEQPPRRALVTGASGFIGRALARRLMELGGDVHLLVRDADRLDDDLRDGCQVHEVGTTTTAMLELVERIHPDACFHVASCFLAVHQPDDVERLVVSNVLFGTQLAEACSRVEGLRFVDVGTSWQHHDSGDEYRPVNLYAATKQAFQDVLRWYADATSLRASTVKLFDTYGPDDRRGKLLAALARTAADPSLDAMHMSPGEQEIDLLHVDDVVDALLHAWRVLGTPDGASYADYGLSSGRVLTLRELVDVFAVATGRRPRVEFGALGYREREVMRTWRPGRELPGWSPSIPLERGLAATFGADPG